MVSRLIEMKEGVKEWGTSNRSLKITDQQWEALESFQKCLRPFRVAIRKLQKEALTPGDFYKIWMQTKVDTKKVDASWVSLKLLERMEVREKMLIDGNPFMLAGIYCDPRFTSTLSQDYGG